MDRFEHKGDKQNEPAWMYCELSGDEIYLGESYLETMEGNVLRDDFKTLINHYNVKRKWAGEDLD